MAQQLDMDCGREALYRQPLALLRGLAASDLRERPSVVQLSSRRHRMSVLSVDGEMIVRVELLTLFAQLYNEFAEPCRGLARSPAQPSPESKVQPRLRRLQSNNYRPPLARSRSGSFRSFRSLPPAGSSFCFQPALNLPSLT